MDSIRESDSRAEGFYSVLLADKEMKIASFNERFFTLLYSFKSQEGRQQQSLLATFE